jgi:hypothetical protein
MGRAVSVQEEATTASASGGRPSPAKKGETLARLLHVCACVLWQHTVKAAMQSIPAAKVLQPAQHNSMCAARAIFRAGHDLATLVTSESLTQVMILLAVSP